MAVLTEPEEDGPAIQVRGARVHNLQNIDVDIPRDRLVVFSGVSGSGKSSLAFDTIHAEGQRRYIEGLSAYARQFLDQQEPPDVDAVDGLPPTVSIDQRSGIVSARSTVGTITEIHDYLRLLYARAGTPHCPRCGRPIRRQTPDQIVTEVMALTEGTKLLVLAPMIRGRKGSHVETFATIRREGLIRARVDGATIEIGEEPPRLAKTKVHTIEAVVDRLVIREGIRPRVAESVDRALKLGEGTAILSDPAGVSPDRILSVNFACPECGIGIEEVEPRTFSFNSPYGACPTCTGLGKVRVFDSELLMRDRSKLLDEGAVDPAALAQARKLARTLPLDSRSPVKEWPEGVEAEFVAALEKVLGHDFEQAKGERQKAAIELLRIDQPCPACKGSRLRPEALAVTLAGRSIREVVGLSISEARAFFETIGFPDDLQRIGPPLVREILGRLDFVARVGLDYLSLDRGADTLSGGELQRVRLAREIGAGLVGVCYVLDEPTSALHPRDSDRLIASLKELRDAGNTVLVVEHDEAMIRAADWVVDLGPGAGTEGGRITAQGPPETLDPSEGSATARFLSRKTPTATGPSDRLARSPRAIEIRGAREHHLKVAEARLPIGCLTCVTGVSGSGKSSLIEDTLAPAVRRHLKQGGPKPGAFDEILGMDAIEAMVNVDQSPIGRTPRSIPATIVGVFDEIRKVFALTREAKIRGYGPNRFSFNVKGGRCETCAGQGVRKIEMQFLADLLVTCETCGGQRFNRPTQEVRFKNRSIGDVLAMRVDQAADFFDAVPKVRRGLLALRDAGLGYVTLGQSSTSLSGGEAQRVKLATGLNRASASRTLYLLDEPSTGLHASDVENLIGILERLADQGNTVIVIEHNLEIIRRADWIVDLGPDAGEKGGEVVAMGTPEHLTRVEASWTGLALKNLARNPI